jgi:hypothetical protein
MENINKIDEKICYIDESIAEAYNDLYECLKSPNIDYILSKNDCKSTLESMLSYFSGEEEYEKCALICSVLKKCKQ